MHEYNLLSLYNTIYMYVFTSHHLILDNYFLWSFLWKTVFLILIIFHLPVVLCARLKPLKLIPLYISMSIDVILVEIMLVSHAGETFWI